MCPDSFKQREAMISQDLVREVVVRLLRMAVTSLPLDVVRALEEAEQRETSPVARTQLRTILENQACAETALVPMCQDTGIPLFFVQGKCEPAVDLGIREGVARATEEIPLRPNAVHPLTRKNTGDNTGIHMPFVHYFPGNREYLEITVLPKGAGSENMSALRMLNPSDGLKGLKSFVLDTVTSAGGKPCPPTVVGVGVGGSSDMALMLAKKSLLRSLDVPNTDGDLQALEEDLLDAINRLGIGPMGLGGRATSLGVRVEVAHCHTASLPVAVNLQCWAARKASARLFLDGRVEFSKGGFL